MKYLLLAFIFFTSCKTLQLDKRCRMKPDPGPCEAAIEKYYYDPADKQCKPFTWGGCHGVVPFDFIEECEICVEGSGV
ncbi:MAG: hypothetical protein DHS20C17_08880 [Cyclobacteriaceae bacterium]|nr:MAG: hypothetical protein DHS20C17_08880 [Cyclobacteriaceae bacterium]